MTLLELLVVLALVAVLASLAYPTYRSFVLRAHRMEGIEALLTLASAQERFHLEHGRYASGFEPEVVPGIALNPVTPGGRYRLHIRPSGAGRYVAAASPSPGSGQEQDSRCSTFSLDDTGRRWATDGAGQDSSADCWR